MAMVEIGGKMIGDGHPCFIVAEIGINHNGDIDIAKRLIDAAVAAGADAVKFQKRTVEDLFSPAERARPHKTQFGETYGAYKFGIEFGFKEYKAIDDHCGDGIMWFASCWDPKSVEFVEHFDPPCYKIASACLTDIQLLEAHRVLLEESKPIILSTGGSSMEQVHTAMYRFGDFPRILLHCNSSYPSHNAELNLSTMRTIRDVFNVPVGYSGHETGLATTVAAVALGACMVERHITLDRAMWGSDQAASVEPDGFRRLVRDIRAVEAAIGDGVKRVYPGEKQVMAKLRRVK